MLQLGASVPGAIFIDWETDRLDLKYPVLLSVVCATLSVFLLWGFAKSGVMLAVFAVRCSFLRGMDCLVTD